jgi:MoaA/NifB/PqqE/SkfB family radical SAM enzyme
MIKGTFVNFDIWNACNLRCKFCYNDWRRNIRTYFEDFNDLKKRAKELRNKTDSINLIWWEPLMFPKIFELLEYLEELGFSISVVTNWLWFYKEDFFKKFFSYKSVVKITLSVHSISDENNFKISQRKNIEEKRLVIVDKLCSLQSSWKLKLSVTTVINKYNYDEIIDIFNYYKSKWINSFWFTWIILQKESSKSNIEVSISFNKYVSKLKELNDIINNEYIIVHWLPLCVHYQVWKVLRYEIRELNDKFFKALQKDWKNLLKSHLENKKIINKCKWCSAFLKFCNWIDKDYYNIYKDKWILSIDRESLIGFIKNNYKK